MTSEAWRPVIGYEGFYEVSSLGRVRSLARTSSNGRQIKPRLMSIYAQPSGHKNVKLSRGGASEHGHVHRLVLMAFSGPPKLGQEALHGDGNPGNNHLPNLRWGTRSENLRDSVRHGTHHWAKKTHCPLGHPYSPENTYLASGKRRMCLECLTNRTRERRARLKEQQ